MTDSPEIQTYTTYLNHVAELQDLTVRAAAVEPDIKPLYDEAINAVDSKITALGNDANVQEDVLQRAIGLVPVLEQLAFVRGRVSTEHYEERSRPYLNEAGKFLEFILKYEITDERAEAVRAAAGAAGAVVMKQEVELAEIRVEEPPAVPVPIVEQKTEDAVSDEDRSAAETLVTSPLTQDEVDRRLFVYVRQRKLGDKLTPRELRIAVLGDSEGDPKFQRLLGGAFAELDVSGAWRHSGRRGLGAHYVVTDLSQVPDPEELTTPSETVSEDAADGTETAKTGAVDEAVAAEPSAASAAATGKDLPAVKPDASAVDTVGADAGEPDPALAGFEAPAVPQTTEELLATIGGDDRTMRALKNCLSRAKILVRTAERASVDLSIKHIPRTLARKLGLPNGQAIIKTAAEADLLPDFEPAGSLRRTASVTVTDIILAELARDPKHKEVVNAQHPAVRQLIEIVIRESLDAKAD